MVFVAFRASAAISIRNVCFRDFRTKLPKDSKLESLIALWHGGTLPTRSSACSTNWHEYVLQYQRVFKLNKIIFAKLEWIIFCVFAYFDMAPLPRMFHLNGRLLLLIGLLDSTYVSLSLTNGFQLEANMRCKTFSHKGGGAGSRCCSPVT